MAKNRIIYLFSLITAIIFYIDYLGWISAYALALVLILPLLSLLLSLPSLVKRNVNAAVKGVCRRNEENNIEFSVDGGWFGYSPLCRLKAVLTDHLGDSKTVYEVVTVKGRSTTLPIDTRHCGVFDCAVSKAYFYDYLCLFRFKAKTPKRVTVTVAPTPVCPVPVPDMTAFTAKVLIPKPGGGFSEVYETREYRPGDPINTLHWKLSAKTDKLIIREAMIPEKLTVIVTLDLTKDRTRYDMTLDRLRWVCEELLKHEIPHSVCYLGADDGALHTEKVTDSDDLKSVLAGLMLKPIPMDRESLESRSFPEADWRCHILLNGGGAE